MFMQKKCEIWIINNIAFTNAKEASYESMHPCGVACDVIFCVAKGIILCYDNLS